FSFRTDCFESIEVRERRITFGGEREVEGSLGQEELPFGETDPVKGIGCRKDYLQRCGVGKPNIFRGKHKQPAENVVRVLTSFNHPGHPEKSGIWVASPDALDERAYCVEVVVAVLVVENC